MPDRAKRSGSQDAKVQTIRGCPANLTHVHVFEDILEKGVTKGYNTKYDEGMHGPLKDSYQLRTNFREVAEQVCYVEKSLCSY